MILSHTKSHIVSDAGIDNCGGIVAVYFVQYGASLSFASWWIVPGSIDLEG